VTAPEGVNAFVDWEATTNPTMTGSPMRAKFGETLLIEVAVAAFTASP